MNGDPKNIVPIMETAAPLASTFFSRTGQGNPVGIGILRMDNLSLQSSWQYIKNMTELFKCKDVHGIVLAIDEGGSLISIAHALHSAIMHLKKIYQKPIIAFIEQRALSGAYMIAAAADYIIATPSAYIGNFGVLWQFFDKSRKNAKEHRGYVMFNGNKYADLFNEQAPFTEQRKIVIQELVDDDYEQMRKLLIQARPALGKDDTLWKEAQWYIAADALFVSSYRSNWLPIRCIYLFKITIRKPCRIDRLF